MMPYRICSCPYGIIQNELFLVLVFLEGEDKGIKYIGKALDKLCTSKGTANGFLYPLVDIQDMLQQFCH